MTSHHPNTAENQSLIIAGDESLRTGPSGGDGSDHNVETEAEEGLESDGFRSESWKLKLLFFGCDLKNI